MSVFVLSILIDKIRELISNYCYYIISIIIDNIPMKCRSLETCFPKVIKVLEINNIKKIKVK